MSLPQSGHPGLACHPECMNLLREYLAFLGDCQGLAQSTIAMRRKFVADFLGLGLQHRCIPAELSELHPSTVHDFVISTAKSMNRPSRKHLVTSLRSFLRFAHVERHVLCNLVEAVPVIAIYELERLPRGLCWDQVQQLLAAPHRQTAAGRRDYAILQVLPSYGVRIGQVTHLRLKDIDWRSGRIHFEASKGGKPLCFPLHPEVDRAVLAYLRTDRGTAPFPELFLTVLGEPRPFSPHYKLGSMLKVYYKRAGIVTPLPGAHAIRFAFATRLLQQLMPIKTIADLLGHRCINSTFIYTKVTWSSCVRWPVNGRRRGSDMKRDFVGPLASPMQRYLKLRHSLGFTPGTTTVSSAEFDR